MAKKLQKLGYKVYKRNINAVLQGKHKSHCNLHFKSI